MTTMMMDHAAETSTPAAAADYVTAAAAAAGVFRQQLLAVLASRTPGYFGVPPAHQGDGVHRLPTPTSVASATTSPLSAAVDHHAAAAAHPTDYDSARLKRQLDTGKRSLPFITRE